MSLTVSASNPTYLLNKIKEYIDIKKIGSWVYDEDGDFTLASHQWHNHAWMHPIVNDIENKLIFGIIGRRGYDITQEEYAVFHIELTKMFLMYFDTDVKNIDISALGNRFDILKSTNP